MIVLLGHVSAQVNFGQDNNALLKLIQLIINCLYNGPAAVLIFFVISGFCIHFPNRERKTFNIPTYYIRRILRISIPSIIALIIYRIVGIEAKYPDYLVMWSLICELIYYILYPLLMLIRHRIKWEPIIAIAFFITFAYIFSHTSSLKGSQNSYIIFGLSTWVIGLPVWLLGCWLAENMSRFSLLTPLKMILMRVVIFLITVALRIVKFHINTVWSSNTITLTLLSFLVCFWIGHELIYYQSHTAPKLLEWGGKWSYSLYIIHPIAPQILKQQLPLLSNNTVISVVIALSCAYIFYLCVEKPSHQLAVKLSKRVNPPVPSVS